MKRMVLSSVVLATSLLSGCASQAQQDDFMNSVGDGLNTAGDTIGDAFAVLGFENYKNGVQVLPETLAKLKVGKSTKEDVVLLIGNAPEMQEMRSKEVWRWPYTEIAQFGGNINETTVVEFNNDGVVEKVYKVNGQSSPTGNPLVDAANGQG